MGIFLAFFVVVSLVCLILLIKIKLKQRRSQVIGIGKAWMLHMCLSLSRTPAPGGAATEAEPLTDSSCVLTKWRPALAHESARALN